MSVEILVYVFPGCFVAFDGGAEDHICFYSFFFSTKETVENCRVLKKMSVS